MYAAGVGCSPFGRAAVYDDCSSWTNGDQQALAPVGSLRERAPACHPFLREPKQTRCAVSERNPDNAGAMPACRRPDGRCGCAGIERDGRFAEACRLGDPTEMVCAADPSKLCCMADDGRSAKRVAEGTAEADPKQA